MSQIAEITNKAINVFKKIDRKYLIFFVFLLISTFFWLLNALSEDYTTMVKHPVIYKNMPSDRVLVNKLPSELEFKIKAHGFDILKELLTRNTNPISIDVKKHLTSSKKGKDGLQSFFILTEQRSSDIVSQMSKDITVELVEPDSIIFTFSEIIRRKIPVVPNLIVSFEKQHQAKTDMQVSPDSVIISGPALIVDSLKHIETDTLTLTNLSQTTQRSLSLQKPKYTSVTPARATVIVPVEKYTEGRFTVPISTINTPEGYTVDVLPDIAEVSFTSGLSSFQNISAQEFIITADAANILENRPEKLKLTVSHSHINIKNLQITPQRVEYILTKKPVKTE